jgi:hypothetical protein
MATPVTNSTTLYVAGPIPVTRSMGLVTVGIPLNEISGSPPLFTAGCSGIAGARYKTTPLVAQAVSGQSPTRFMCCFAAGATPGKITRHLNLWNCGVPYKASKTTTLVAANHQSGVVNSIPLLVVGSGIGFGGVPISRTLPLYVARQPGAAISLFAKGPGAPATSGVSLFVQPSVSGVKVTTLVVPKVVGPIPLTAPFYTHGF